MRALALLSLPLLLAACVLEPGGADRDACGAANYQGLVGQSEAVLSQMRFPLGTRVIRPGSPVTADFNAERLNIEIAQTGQISRVACF